MISAVATAAIAFALVVGQAGVSYASAKPAPSGSSTVPKAAPAGSATPSKSAAAATPTPKSFAKPAANAPTAQQQRAKAGKAALASTNVADTCSGAIQPTTVYPCANLDAGATDTFTLAVPHANDLVFLVVTATDGEQLPVTMTAPDASSVTCQLNNGFPGPYQCATGAAGSYTLQIADAGTAVGFTVSYVPLLFDTACTAITTADLSFTAPNHTGSLAAGAVGDCFSLNQPAGTVLQNLTFTYQIAASVFDSTGAQICGANSNCTLTGTGPYRVLVAEVYADAMDYRWQFDRLSNPTGCLAQPTLSYGRVPVSTSTDLCRALDAPTAGDYQVGAVTPDGGNMSGTVYDATGTQICQVGLTVCTLPAGLSYLIVDQYTSPLAAFGVVFFAVTETSGCTPINDTGFASGAVTGSFIGAGEQICLTLPTASGKAVTVLNGLTANVVAPYVQVVDASGAQMCNNFDFGYGICTLSGTAPFRVLLSNEVTGAYNIMAQRTDSAAGCLAWPQSGFDGSYGVSVALTASARAKCLSIPAGQHSTGEMIDYSNTANVVNASVAIIGPAGNTVCTGNSTAVCALTAGTSYTALLVGSEADTYHLVRRDISQTATCAAPVSTTPGGASTQTMLTSDLDARCYRVTAAAGDKLMMGVRAVGVGSSGAILEVADGSGHIVCRQFGVPCRVSGSTTYQVIVIASGYAGTSIQASTDIWLVGSATDWSSTCKAHTLSMGGFAPITDTLTESHTGYCAVVPIKPSQAMGVFGASSATSGGFPWVSMYGTDNWTSFGYCNNLNSGDLADLCSIPSSATAGQAVMLVFPYDNAALPLALTMQGVCAQSCTPATPAPTMTSVTPATGQSGSTIRMVVKGTGLNMGDQVRLTDNGSPMGNGYMSSPVTASADGTSLTIDFFPYAVDAGAYDITLIAPGTNGWAGGPSVTLPQAFTVTAAAPAVNGDLFEPLSPTRILDTRSGLGAPKARVGAGGTVKLQVDGAGGVPTSGVTAVVLNVTAVNASAATYISVYPDGEPVPASSNLNVAQGQTLPNLVTVRVVNGIVDINNHAGNVDLLADVVGYYDNEGSGSALNTTGPQRILDTRSSNQRLGAGGTVSLQVAGVGGVPAYGVTAVVLNVTAVNPSAASYVTVYPDSHPLPNVSNLNFVAGQTIANLVIVPVYDGKIDLRNANGNVDLLADVTGYYATGGSGFQATGPTRLLDTRNGTGGHTGAVGPGGIVTLTVAGVQGIPATGVTAVVLNVTVTGPTASSWLTVYPDGQPLPGVSNLNFGPGQTLANLVIVPVINGKIDFRNANGSTQILADVAGYFTS